MTIGIVGEIGNTRVFTDEGVSVPVTVVEVLPNRVTQIKELDTDGYRALIQRATVRPQKSASRPQGILPRQVRPRVMACGSSGSTDPTRRSNWVPS